MSSIKTGLRNARVSRILNCGDFGPFHAVVVFSISYSSWLTTYFEAFKHSISGKVRPNTYLLLHLDLSIPSWPVWVEIKCMHDSLPKRPKYQFKPVQQSRQQALRAYCSVGSNILCFEAFKLIQNLRVLTYK